MTSKERLEQYVKEDIIYNEYLDEHKSYVSDFDKFCIEHCEDIKNVLKENEKLKKELEKSINDYCRLDAINRNQQKEFIKYLKEPIKIITDGNPTNISEYTMGKLDTLKEILSKYKEIIGDVEDE